jgi:hypothetical protein
VVCITNKFIHAPTFNYNIAIKSKEWLTPKGLNVRTADKPVLVSVTWAHTIFIFFETFRADATYSKLRVKKKFIFFGPTDQKLWVFEVSRRSLGRAGMCWSQPARVDHLCKKWRPGRKKISKKKGTARQLRRQPAAGERPLVAGRGLTPQLVELYLVFWNFFI